jgi:hypothetical protein
MVTPISHKIAGMSRDHLTGLARALVKPAGAAQGALIPGFAASSVGGRSLTELSHKELLDHVHTLLQTTLTPKL